MPEAQTRVRYQGMDLETLKARIARVLSAFAEVRAAYLFGSAATGRSRADSDLDLGIVTGHPLGKRKLDLLTAFAREGLDRVDLVALSPADVVLRYEAVHPNCLIYARHDFDHGAFFSKAVREYFDLMPHLQRQRQALKQRLLHAQT